MAKHAVCCFHIIAFMCSATVNHINPLYPSISANNGAPLIWSTSGATQPLVGLPHITGRGHHKSQVQQSPHIPQHEFYFLLKTELLYWPFDAFCEIAVTVVCDIFVEWFEWWWFPFNNVFYQSRQNRKWDELCKNNKVLWGHKIYIMLYF